MRRPCDKATQPGRARLSLSLLTLLALALAGHASGPRAATGQPYIPANDDVVLQQVPATTDPRVRRFRRLRERLRAHPDDRDLALQLARAYVDYGRATGDARYLGRALSPLAPWLSADNPPPDVLIVYATILQSRHHFDAARAQLRRALTRAPDNTQGWLTLATVNMVQGRFDEARRACVHTANTGGRYMAILCNGALLSRTGRADKAYRLLSLIAGGGERVPVDVRAYVQGLLAAAAERTARPELADRHYRQALQLTPGDNFLLANYADALLDQGRPQDVIDLLENDTASDTSFLRLVLAQAALGRPETAADIQTMAARFKAMEQRDSHVYRRAQVRFVLYLQHEPEHALALAQKNWTVQRAPKDVRVFLEAALAAHAPQAARPVIAFIDRTGLSDPPIDALAARVSAALDADQGQSGTAP